MRIQCCFSAYILKYEQLYRLIMSRHFRESPSREGD